MGRGGCVLLSCLHNKEDCVPVHSLIALVLELSVIELIIPLILCLGLFEMPLANLRYRKGIG